MGAFLAILAAFSLTLRDVVSKRLSSNVPADLSTFASFLFALPFYIILGVILFLVLENDFRFTSAFFLLVVLRGLTDVLAEGSRMRAFATGDLSLVTTLLCFTPIFLLIISPPITGDPVRLNDVIGILLVFTGSVVFVYSGGDYRKPGVTKAIAYSILASFCFALNNCFDRLAVVKAGPIESGFFMTLLAGLCTAPVLLKFKNSSEILAGNSKSFLLRGALEFLFMTGKLAALQYYTAPMVYAFLRSSIIFSLLAGVFIFKESVSFRKVLAVLIVFGGVICSLF